MDHIYIIIDFIEENWSAFVRRCEESNSDPYKILEELKKYFENK